MKTKADRAAYMRRWMAGRRRAGLCVMCGVKLPVAKNANCRRCRDLITLRAMRRLTNMSLQEIAAVIDGRYGQCEICHRPAAEAGRHGVLDFDHCHKTGAFRGWLCNACNQLLGRFGDDPARFMALADYLIRKTPSPATARDDSVVPQEK